MGGKGVLKNFCREKGYEKLHPLPPSTVYILNAALPNKKGGLSCDKVKFGTAMAYNFSIKHYTRERANLHCYP